MSRLLSIAALASVAVAAKRKVRPLFMSYLFAVARSCAARRLFLPKSRTPKMHSALPLPPVAAMVYARPLSAATISRRASCFMTYACSTIRHQGPSMPPASSMCTLSRTRTMTLAGQSVRWEIWRSMRSGFGRRAVTYMQRPKALSITDSGRSLTTMRAYELWSSAG